MVGMPSGTGEADLELLSGMNDPIP